MKMDKSRLIFTEREPDFDFTERGYTFKALHLEAPKGDSLIEISKDGEIVREFLWPSYKIWNIAAHSHDIINGLEKESDEGLRLAGSTGFGGSVFN